MGLRTFFVRFWQNFWDQCVRSLVLVRISGFGPIWIVLLSSIWFCSVVPLLWLWTLSAFYSFWRWPRAYSGSGSFLLLTCLRTFAVRPEQNNRRLIGSSSSYLSRGVSRMVEYYMSLCLGCSEPLSIAANQASALHNTKNSTAGSSSVSFCIRRLALTNKMFLIISTLSPYLSQLTAPLNSLSPSTHCPPQLTVVLNSLCPSTRSDSEMSN